VCWLLWRCGEMSGYQPRSLQEEIGFLAAEIRPRRDSLRQSERLRAKRITSFGIEMVPSV